APDAEVLDGAMQHAADQVEEDYFPWTETLSVEFLKDSDCDLKQAYNMVKAGHVAGALQQSQANVATCQADKNQTHQAHALYNLGVAQMLAGHYDEALRSIRKAEVLHDDRRNGEALGQAQRLQANAQEMASNQAVQAAAAASAQHQADARQQRVASETLDNATIVKLVKGGFSDAVVVKMIASQPGSYTTTPDALLSLKQSGVSDTVIAALLDKKN
ncbi:MAG: tetratricopeptide repeat protein, partial [Terriglobales bacterium]